MELKLHLSPTMLDWLAALSDIYFLHMWIFWCLIITLVLLISAPSELVWCLLGDGLAKSLLP